MPKQSSFCLLKHSIEPSCRTLNNEKQILQLLKEKDFVKFGFPDLISSSINFEGSELVTNAVGTRLNTIVNDSTPLDTG